MHNLTTYKPATTCLAMKLIDALNLAATTRPAWRTNRGSWTNPHDSHRVHLLRLFGENKNIKKITKGDLAHARTQLLMEKKAPATVNRIMSMLNTMFTEMVDHEVIEKYPRMKQLQENNQRKGFFTQENIKDLVKACNEVFLYHELADAIQFSLYTGCRRGNMLNVEVRDIDLINDTIEFRDCKNGEDYSVDIHPNLREILAMRCDGERPNCKIFQFSNGDQVLRQFKKVRHYLGLSEDLVYHSLRHTCGTWLADRGVPVQNIAKVLGHKTLEMSMRYTHLSDKARKSAINSL